MREWDGLGYKSAYFSKCSWCCFLSLLYYRAKYIEESAKKILELGGEDWLLSLRKMDYIEAKQSLLQLSGKKRNTEEIRDGNSLNFGVWFGFIQKSAKKVD